jgi:hypothetical protein
LADELIQDIDELLRLMGAIISSTKKALKQWSIVNDQCTMKHWTLIIKHWTLITEHWKLNIE